MAAAHERGQLLPAASEQRGLRRMVEITASSQGHDEDVQEQDVLEVTAVSGLLYFMSDLRFLEKGADNAQRLDFKTGDRVRLNAAGLEVPEDDELRAMSCRQRVAAAQERGQLLPAASEQRGLRRMVAPNSCWSGRCASKRGTMVFFNFDLTLVAFFASAWTTHSAREAQTVLLESLRPIIVIECAKPEAPPCEEANQFGGMLEEITEEVFEPPPPLAIGDCFPGVH